MTEDSDKILQFEDYQYLRNVSDEDRKKKQQKMQSEYERRQRNESVLRNYRLGKFKDK